MDQKWIRADIEHDFVKTPTGRVSFMVSMVQFAKYGEKLCATECVIKTGNDVERKVLVVECIFSGYGYQNHLTVEEKRTFYLDMVASAFLAHTKIVGLEELMSKISIK
jgi:hypothetical protein